MVNTTRKSSAGNVFRFNVNSKLNELLMKLNMSMGLLRQGQVVDVDFDHVFVRTEKADAKYSYKQAFGYFSDVVSIDGVIAYIENRDGHTPVKFHQEDTLTRAFELLHSKDLVINMFRTNCGSYAEDIIQAADDNCRVFYIRTLHSAAMYTHIEDISVWKRVQIDLQDTEVASFMSSNFKEDSHYRIVVQRLKTRTKHPICSVKGIHTAASLPMIGIVIKRA